MVQNQFIRKHEKPTEMSFVKPSAEMLEKRSKTRAIFDQTVQNRNKIFSKIPKIVVNTNFLRKMNNRAQFL